MSSQETIKKLNDVRRKLYPDFMERVERDVNAIKFSLDFLLNKYGVTREKLCNMYYNSTEDSPIRRDVRIGFIDEMKYLEDKYNCSFEQTLSELRAYKEYQKGKELEVRAEKNEERFNKNEERFNKHEEELKKVKDAINYLKVKYNIKDT
jgi:hypothetical protein